MSLMRAFAAAVASLLVASAAPSAEARDWAFIGAGAISVTEPAARKTDVPFLGPTILAGLFDGSGGTWRVSSGLVCQLSGAWGPRGAWQGDAWVGYTASLGLTELIADPFIAFGADLAWFERDDDTSGLVAGVRADLGVHGILFDWLFWRACVGFVGPGIGGVRTELSVGHGFF
jgi:hypothetical protein